MNNINLPDDIKNIIESFLKVKHKIDNVELILYSFTFYKKKYGYSLEDYRENINNELDLNIENEKDLDSRQNYLIIKKIIKMYFPFLEQ